MTYIVSGGALDKTTQSLTPRPTIIDRQDKLVTG